MADKKYYCSSCLVPYALHREIRSLDELYPPNRAPFKTGIECGLCGRKGRPNEAFFPHQDMDEIILDLERKGKNAKING